MYFAAILLLRSSEKVHTGAGSRSPNLSAYGMEYYNAESEQKSESTESEPESAESESESEQQSQSAESESAEPQSAERKFQGKLRKVTL